METQTETQAETEKPQEEAANNKKVAAGLIVARIRYFMDPLLLESPTELPPPTTKEYTKKGSGCQAVFVVNVDGKRKSFTRHLVKLDRWYLNGFRKVHEYDEEEKKVVVRDCGLSLAQHGKAILKAFADAEIPVPPAFLQAIEGRLA